MLRKLLPGDWRCRRCGCWYVGRIGSGDICLFSNAAVGETTARCNDGVTGQKVCSGML